MLKYKKWTLISGANWTTTVFMLKKTRLQPFFMTFSELSSVVHYYFFFFASWQAKACDVKVKIKCSLVTSASEKWIDTWEISSAKSILLSLRANWIKLYYEL